MKMLTELHIIDEQGSAKKYFYDEYGLSEDGEFNVSDLEKEYIEFVDNDGNSIVEKLCSEVMYTISEYCTAQAKDIKHELERAKSGGQPDKINRMSIYNGPSSIYIHQFDFKRWFQLDVAVS